LCCICAVVLFLVEEEVEEEEEVGCVIFFQCIVNIFAALHIYLYIYHISFVFFLFVKVFFQKTVHAVSLFHSFTYITYICTCNILKKKAISSQKSLQQKVEDLQLERDEMKRLKETNEVSVCLISIRHSCLLCTF
jgi:hypothetical protein